MIEEPFQEDIHKVAHKNFRSRSYNEEESPIQMVVAATKIATTRAPTPFKTSKLCKNET
jgi:hypothetical protein